MPRRAGLNACMPSQLEACHALCSARHALLAAARLLCHATPRRRSAAAPLCLAVMEKYVRNARFCLICNYVSKIIPALQARFACCPSAQT